MAESAFVVAVPEAERYVGELRARFDPSAKEGMPAHITLLYPFMAPSQIAAAVLERARSAFSGIPAFEFRLLAPARFPGALYLPPDPAAPFVGLAECLVQRFPDYPPYRGEHAAIVPHLTVAQGGEAELQLAQAELAGALPRPFGIRASCREVLLLENASGTWRRLCAFGLAAPALDFVIATAGPLSQAARSRGYRRFAELTEALRALPYGRGREGAGIAEVLDAGSGTCSTKHRFLAALAHECGHEEVKLMIGLYEMSEQNTPGVGKVLAQEGLDAIPEAHCYLAYAGARLDFTGLAPGASSPFDTLMEERVASPADLPVVKRAYHRAAIDAWARERGLDPERVWAIRERCIAALASRCAFGAGNET